MPQTMVNLCVYHGLDGVIPIISNHISLQSLRLCLCATNITDCLKISYNPWLIIGYFYIIVGLLIS